MQFLGHQLAEGSSLRCYIYCLDAFSNSSAVKKSGLPMRISSSEIPDAVEWSSCWFIILGFGVRRSVVEGKPAT